MSGRPWYKRYGADFVHGCLGLTLEEKGAYSLCLDLIYDRGGPIPDDARWLAGVCGVSLRKWASLRGRLIEAGKLVERDGRLYAEIIDRWKAYGGRESIPQEVRAFVFDRDGTKCAYCEDTVGPFHIDHIRPVCAGGDNKVDNLTVACARCNLSKGGKLLHEWMSMQ